MRNLFLISYSVRGIKSLDNQAELSFYKKTFIKSEDNRKYNLKAIYGENGSGKSGIITSSQILKNLIIQPDYLVNRFVQKQLSELVNKKLGFVKFSVEYYTNIDDIGRINRYDITVSKDHTGKYSISNEELCSRKANSHSQHMQSVFKVEKGVISDFKEEGEFTQFLRDQTKNLLTSSSLSAVYLRRVRSLAYDDNLISGVKTDLLLLYLFGDSIYTYLDSEDEHAGYFLNDMLENMNDNAESTKIAVELLYKSIHFEKDPVLLPLHPGRMTIPKSLFDSFELQVAGLSRFIQIFKPQLNSLLVQKREDGQFWSCEIIAKYDDYSIYSEFESTGIKKLIKLYSYIQKAMEGNIVFIDELDSNLHDVYLCALLDYIMEYAQGQLCFTTHNIGPMDVLKKNKKSIDFLGSDHMIYPWVSNGNYSPSKLYRGGMIAGSPFNIDSTDFIGVFETTLED